jgi:hypothetical protein
VDFDEAKQEYLRLKSAFEAGDISASQFEEAVYGLIFVDRQGELWQIGLSSGEWYRKEGDAWIESVPPEDTSILKISPKAVSTAPERIAHSKGDPYFLNLPVWAWTFFALGGLVTLLGIFAVLTFYYINQRPTPIAVARTLVVYETETPTAVLTSTRTVVGKVVETAAPEETSEPVPTSQSIVEVTPTLTATPVLIPSPQPSVNPNRPPAVTWKQLSQTDFDRLENMKGEWLGILDYFIDEESGSYDFVNYKGLNSMRLRYTSEYTDIFMETADEDLILRDVEIEEVLAIPSGSKASYADIMCRFEDWSFTYSFSINTDNWTLFKYDDDQEVQLATGLLPSNFRSGEWGRFRMRCVGDTISVWLNSRLLASVRDTTFPTGQWAISLYRNEGFTEADLYMYSHRVYEQRNETALLGDMVQTGDTFITLDRGWLQEGSRYSLGVWIENRTADTLNIESDQIYLLRPDGKKISVDPNPPEGNGFKFPFNLRESLRVSNLYFQDITADDIDWGLQLVIDLTSSGLSEIRFQLPVE